jgi:hypothetical protein
MRLSIAPLAPGFQGTPQDLTTAIENNATIVTDQALSLFIVGSAAPTSNQGPFFLNGTTLYVWSQNTGSYIPVILDPKSLRYIITQTPPADNTDYDVVFKLSSTSSPVGDPVEIDVWYNGAWTAIGVTQAYLLANYYTQSQVSGAIAAATSYAFKAVKQATNQTITSNAGDTQVTFDSKIYDPSNSYSTSTNVYTCPVSGVYHFGASCAVGLASGSPTGVAMPVKIRKNGVIAIEYDDFGSTGTGLRTNRVSGELSCTAGDSIDVDQQVNSTGAATWNATNDTTKTFFSGFLVQTL